MTLLDFFFRRRRPVGLVLLYHRVTQTDLDPQLLAVRPDAFAAQLGALRQFGDPMRLDELVEAVEVGKLRRPAIAVTFDDGYADNLEFAKPVLDRYGVPATVFACSDPVIHHTEYWWDTLERALLRESGRADLELQLPSGARRWELDGRPADFPGWNVLSHDDPTPRHKAYRELMPLVKALAPAKRAELLGQALRQLGLRAGPHDGQRPMSAAQLRELVAGGTIAVGAHTVSHAQLSSLPREEQEREIARSKVALEDIVQREVTSFAYPYGSRDDYSDDAVAAVRRAGFSLACSNFHGIVRRGADRLQLPRIIVRDVPPEALRADLARAVEER